MNKKPTWIKVHSNILEPKHQKAIGERIWLFLYLVDNANWLTGIVPEYTDADAAHDLGRSKRTIERWRADLIKAGYIVCRQIQHGQEVTINRWRNPQQVNADPINIPIEGTQICHEKKVQGTHQGTQQGRQIRVPSQAQTEHATQYTIHNKDSAADAEKAKRAALFEAVLLHAFKITYIPKMALPSSTQGRVGRIVKALVDIGTTAEEYTAYATAWKQEHPNLTPVQSETKLPLEVLAFRENKPAAPAVRLLTFDNERVITQADREAGIRKLEEARRAKRSQPAA